MRVRDSADNDETSMPSFLQSGGEMGAQIARFRWDWHPLGPVDMWPKSLKTAVNLILSSPQPMWVGWGPQMWFLYNDAYLNVLGPAKHPGALGRPTSDIWPEIWDVCRPLANNVLLYGEAGLVFDPIRDECGEVAGLLCPSKDVTAAAVRIAV